MSTSLKLDIQEIKSKLKPIVTSLKLKFPSIILVPVIRGLDILVNSIILEIIMVLN
jgi:hypothetical protein